MEELHDPADALACDLAGIRDRDQRQRLFLEHAAPFGVHCFAYLNTTQPWAPFHVETTYPAEWVRRYLDQDFVAIDVVALEATRSPVPFRWQAALSRPDAGADARRVFDEAAEFGLRDGYTIPIHARAGLSMMSMAVDDPALFGPASARRRRALHLMAMQYHMACERDLYDAAHPKPHLTPRECEVLTWAAQGKTGWEIARILRLTERTVTYHMENAKTKLGAASRSQAVVAALTLGLIRP